MLVFGQKFPCKKGNGAVQCRDATASSFVAKIRDKVFARFHAGAIKRYGIMQN
jgi:hypothetical protein